VVLWNQGSRVCIATRVRSGRSRVRIPVRGISLSKASRSAQTASYTMVTGVLSFNICKHPVPSLGMCGAVPLLSFCGFMAFMETNLPLLLTK